MTARVSEYDELAVRLVARDGEYSVSVSAPSGATGHGTFRLPFREAELKRFRQRVDPGVLQVRGKRTPRRSVAEEFGGKLYEALVADPDVRQVFATARSEADAQNRNLRITLHVTAAPDLTAVPWEFLYCQPLFLAKSVHTPIVRFIDRGEARRPLKVAPPLRILGMVSRPRGGDFPELNVEGEKADLEDRLSELTAAGQVQLRWLEEGTLAALQREVDHGEQFHIFHYVGHGEYDEAKREGYLILEGPEGQPRRVSGRDLGTVLTDNKSLRLAVLNACEAAVTPARDPLAGVATSLMEYGVPAVIGMQFSITDEAAVVFANELYRTLADGDPIDSALTKARRALIGESDEEWATPVLFMGVADGRLFDLGDETTFHTGWVARPSIQPREEAAAPEHVAEEPAPTAASGSSGGSAKRHHATQPPSTVDLRIGSTFADYLIEDLLGSGRIGSVYRAVHRAPDRTDALKVFSPEVSANRRFHDHFLKEARIIAGLAHPHLVAVNDFGECDGRLYVASRLIEGMTLRAVLGECGRLEPRLAARLIAQVASVLDAAHAAGVLHLNVSPANIWISGRQKTDSAYLTDFGQATEAVVSPDLDQIGALVGTIDYSAPEQLRGDSVSARTDIYSLGCVLYEALTGAPPFPAPSVAEKIAAHVGAPCPVPSRAVAGLPTALDNVIRKALAKNPRDRYATAAEFANEALGAVAAAPASPRTQPRDSHNGRQAGAPAAHAQTKSRRGGSALARARVANRPTRKETRAPAVQLPYGGEGVWRWVGHPAVAFSPDGATIATASHDGTARIWSVPRARQTVRIAHGKHTNAVAFSPDGTLLATAGTDKTARVWTTHGREVACLAHGGVVLAVAFNPDGTKLATGGEDSTARIWSLSGARELKRVTHAAAVTAVAFSPDGKLIATASSDGSARVWNVSDGLERICVTHEATVRGVAFSPDGTAFATASDDKTARIWRLVDGRELIHVAHDGIVRGIAFSGDGTSIATASADNTARVWDASDGSELARTQHSGWVLGVAFSGDSQRVATVSQDKTARVTLVSSAQSQS